MKSIQESAWFLLGILFVVLLIWAPEQNSVGNAFNIGDTSINGENQYSFIGFTIIVVLLVIGLGMIMRGIAREHVNHEWQEPKQIVKPTISNVERKRLHTYIIAQLEQGVPVQTLKEELRNQGHDEEIIQEELGKASNNYEIPLRSNAHFEN